MLRIGAELAGDRRRPVREVDVCPSEPADLADPSTAVDEQLHHAGRKVRPIRHEGEDRTDLDGVQCGRSARSRSAETVTRRAGFRVSWPLSTAS